MSLTHQVAAVLRAQIIRGELPAGTRLPSERALAERQEVSRVTVVRALTRLRSEGLLVTRHGSGTFVATTDRLLDSVAPASAQTARSGGLDLREATTAGPIDLLEIAGTAIRTRLPEALRGDGTTAAGTGLLTELLAGHLTATGLGTRPDQLVLTTGATSALDLILDAFAPPGRHAITETPTYPGALTVLARHNRKVLGWPAGPGGWDTGHLAHLVRAHPPGVLYLQPDGHNPTGCAMPPGARDKAVRAATAAGWTIIADETMRLLRLSGEQLPSLASYDGRVLTVSSLSKTVWGGLRLGWIRASAKVARRLRRAVSVAAGPGALDQAVATELLASLDELVLRRRRLLAENLRHLEHLLRGIDEPGLTWRSPTGGVTLWLDLGGRSAQDVVAACARRGVLLEPTSTYTVTGRDDTHLRLPFTFAPPVLDTMVEALAQAVRARRIRS